MSRDNLGLALGAASEYRQHVEREGSHNARASEIRDTIDGLVGWRVDGRWVWSEVVCKEAGLSLTSKLWPQNK